MSRLSRWMPYRFRRNESAQRAAELSPTEAEPRWVPRTPQRLSPGWSDPTTDKLQTFLGDPFLRDPVAHFSELERWFGDYAPSHFQPTVDVIDEESALKVTAELPGMSKDDIDLTIDDDVLTIRGEKKNGDESQENGAFRTERFYGYFQRNVPLPRDVDHTKCSALFEHGVLTLRFPKSEEPTGSAKRIEITT